MATSFSLFPELPIELQRMIWCSAVENIEPRTVYLQYRKLAQHRSHRVWSSKSLEDPTFFTANADPSLPAPDTNPPEDDRRAKKGFRCVTPPPVLLFACWEAHFAMKKSYTRAFSTSASFPETWIDFNKDILYMGCHMRCILRGSNPCLASISQADMTCPDFLKIKTIAIDYRGFGGRAFPASVAVISRLFPSVTKFIIPDRQYKRFVEAVVMDGLVANIDRAIESYTGKRDCHQNAHAVLAELDAEHASEQIIQGLDKMQEIMSQYWKEHELQPTPYPVVEHRTFVDRKKKLRYDTAKRAYEGNREAFKRNCGKGCKCPPTEDAMKILAGKFQVVLGDIERRDRGELESRGMGGSSVEMGGREAIGTAA